MEGVEIQNNQRGIVKEALRGKIADLKVYLQHRQKKRLSLML